MRLTGSRAYYRSTPPKMPPGLVELIEGLTREVLKNNPTDIYGFCASHMKQLLEIRDGPVQKKTLTLEEKIAKAQEKVRQRAEKRKQRYDNDLLGQQSGKSAEINATTIKNDAPPTVMQASAANNIAKTAPLNEQELIVTNEQVKLSHDLLIPMENSRYQEINEVATKYNDDLNNDVKTEPAFTENESKSDINLAESSNKSNDTIPIHDPTLNTPPNKENIVTDEVIVDNNSYEPMVDEKIKNDKEQSNQDNKELLAEADVSQGFNEIIPEKHVSSPIHSTVINQDCGLVHFHDKMSTELVEAKNQADNNLDEPKSITQSINIITNDELETESDKVLLSLNTEDTDQSNVSDNVELTTNIDNIVDAKEEDPLETNTFDISFKESPTVELQDPQLNLDILDSLLETNTDGDIVTLITQESANDELKHYNDFKRDTPNADLPEGSKDNPESDQINSRSIEQQENTKLQNEINTIDTIEHNIKKYNDINNSDHETSTDLCEPSQIHNQDSNMNLETAAITIQKVFRTFLFKSRASTFEDTVNDDTIYLNEADKNKEECNFSISGPLNERRPHGITRMDTVLQTVNEEKSLSLSTDDSSTLSSAATVIQAHVRGFLVRNKLNSNKTISTNSLAASNSKEPSLTSLEMDNEHNKNKTVLNIHIVPEGGNYLSRDESLITSMDLSLDSSPPSSINLHPLGYDKSERRKQLKREDAIQSISPPSNNSGKLSEDVDSVNEITEEPQVEHINFVKDYINFVKDHLPEETDVDEVKAAHTENVAFQTIASDNTDANKENNTKARINSDEMDVVTPFISNEDSSDLKLMHSGEFHDTVLPTKVSRSDTSVASEFKNVLVYFLLWNHT